MKKIISLAVAGVLAAGLLTACGGSSAETGSAAVSSKAAEETSEQKTDGEKYVIGACLAQTNITPFGTHMYQDLVELCEEKGWELISMDSERDATKEAQNIQTLLLQDLDLMFYWPYDKEAAVTNVQQASEENIPVITVNADVAEEGQEYTVAYVGPDQYNMASDVAEYIADKTGGEGKICVVDGTAGTTQYILRMQGFEETLEKYPNLEIIAHEYTDGDRNEAITLTENYLTTYGDEISAIYVPAGDNCAVGVAQVVAEAGLSDQIMILSNDGMQEALDLIEEGEMTGTMMQKPLYQVEKFGELAAEY